MKKIIINIPENKFKLFFYLCGYFERNPSDIFLEFIQNYIEKYHNTLKDLDSFKKIINSK